MIIILIVGNRNILRTADRQIPVDRLTVSINPIGKLRAQLCAGSGCSTGIENKTTALGISQLNLSQRPARRHAAFANSPASGPRAVGNRRSVSIGNDRCRLCQPAAYVEQVRINATSLDQITRIAIVSGKDIPLINRRRQIQIDAEAGRTGQSPCND